MDLSLVSATKLPEEEIMTKKEIWDRMAFLVSLKGQGS